LKVVKQARDSLGFFWLSRELILRPQRGGTL
jgi:hypothetical protein